MALNKSDLSQDKHKDIHTELAEKSLKYMPKGHWYTKWNFIVGVLVLIIAFMQMLGGFGFLGSNSKSGTNSDTSIRTILPAPKYFIDSQPVNTKEAIVKSSSDQSLTPNKMSGDDEPKNMFTKANDKPSSITTESNVVGYINKTTTKNDIAILVLDNNNHLVNSLLSEIATLYRSKGHSVTTSLFTNSFLNSSYVSEVQTANALVIDKMDLASQVDYVVIAKYLNEFEPGELTKWISRANLDVSIISCKTKSQSDVFSLSVSNGFDDKPHAESGSQDKIIQAFKASHLNL